MEKLKFHLFTKTLYSQLIFSSTARIYTAVLKQFNKGVGNPKLFMIQKLINFYCHNIFEGIGDGVYFNQF